MPGHVFYIFFHFVYFVWADFYPFYSFDVSHKSPFRVQYEVERSSARIVIQSDGKDGIKWLADEKRNFVEIPLEFGDDEIQIYGLGERTTLVRPLASSSSPCSFTNLYLSCTYLVLILYLSCTYLVLILYLSCTYLVLILYSSCTHLVLILSSSYTHLVLILYSSYTHLILILYSSYIHLIFILYSSYIHLIFILYSSYIHLIFILYSPFTQFAPFLLTFCSALSSFFVPNFFYVICSPFLHTNSGAC
jgi:hypothetical protein